MIVSETLIQAILRILLLLFTVIACFTAGPFFLIPFFSQSGSYKSIVHQDQIIYTLAQHNQLRHSTPSLTSLKTEYKLLDDQNATDNRLNNLTKVCHGMPHDESHILFLAVTRIMNLSYKNISLYSLVWTTPKEQVQTNHLRSSFSSFPRRHDYNSLCPKHFKFVPPIHWNETVSFSWFNLMDIEKAEFREKNNLFCVQWHRDDIQFVELYDGDEKKSAHFDPKELSKHVSHLIFNFDDVNSDAPLIMDAFLLDFGAQYKLNSLSSSNIQIKTSCENMSFEKQTAICQQFFQGLVNESASAHIVDPSDPTIRDFYLKRKGLCIENEYCSAMIKLGGERCQQSDFWDSFLMFWKRQLGQTDESTDCYFTLHFALFPPPPSIYSIGDFWVSNVLAFVPSIFFWLFFAIYYGRKIHYNYLQHYYVTPPSFTIDAGSTYNLKLVITGRPFTKYIGKLSIRCLEKNEIIHTFPIAVELDSEDISNTRLCSVKKVLVYQAKENTQTNATFSMSWNGEFEVSNFEAPIVQVIMSKKFPPMITSTFNLFLMPVICLFQIIFNYPKRSSFIRYFEYLYLSFYFSLVNWTLILPVTFTVLLNIRELEFMFWGNVSYKPAIPVIFYTLFCLTQTMALILAHFQLFCRGCNVKKPSYHNITKFDNQQLGTRDQTNFFVVSNNPHHQENIEKEEQDSSFDIEFVPLESKTNIVQTSGTSEDNNNNNNNNSLHHLTATTGKSSTDSSVSGYGTMSSLSSESFSIPSTTTTTKQIPKRNHRGASVRQRFFTSTEEFET